MTPNAAELSERVLLPLLAGGALRPLPPIGPERAKQLAAAEGVMPTGGSMDAVRAHRVRVSRRIACLDALGDLGAGEWMLACALNDLLQVTNPSLLGWFDKDRPVTLLSAVRRTIDNAGPPRVLGEAIARHATFSRVFALRRLDTTVHWWVGSETFVGRKPPQRLLRWRGVRRVRLEEAAVPLWAMAPSSFEGQGFEDVMSSWLSHSPLTDLAHADRERPPFQWTGPTLSLLYTTAGQNLARRVVLRCRDPKQAIAALARATAALGAHPASGPANGLLSVLEG